MTESGIAYFKRLDVRRVRQAALQPSTYRERLRWPAHGTVIAIGVALVGLQALTLGRWIADDAGVTFAYARSVAEGLGPVQQPGAAPVEGYSDPAWLALLVVGRWLGLFDHGSWFGVSDLVVYPKALALLCAAGMLAAVASVARVVLPRRANAVTMVAGLLMAANFSLVAWMFSGLENPLTGLAVMLLTAVLVKGVAQGRLLEPRVATSAALAALLAALNRPDGVIYAAAFPVTVLLFAGGANVSRSVRAVWRYGLVFSVTFGSFLLWRRLEFGMWVPNSAVAKSQSAPSLVDLSHTGDLLSWAGWGLVLPVAACVGAIAARRRPVRARLTDPADAVPVGPALCAALVPLALALLAYGVLKPDWMGMYRFATPVWAAGTLVAAVAIVGVWESERRPRARGVLATVLVAGSALSLATQYDQNKTFSQHPTWPMCLVADRFGRMFNGYADRLHLTNASVLMPDLGGSLLTSRLRIVDLAGLTDRTIAAAYASGNLAKVQSYIFDDVRPTFIHGHDGWLTGNGLTPQVLESHGYVALYQDGNATGDWLRSDAVPDQATLASVRLWAKTTIAGLDTKWRNDGRGGCGADLRVGQTL